MEVSLEFLIDLYRYGQWADRQTLAAVSPLSQESFTRGLGNSFSSVRDTLVHILAAEWIWLERWNGRSPQALLSAAEFSDLASVTSRWKQLEESRLTFLHALRPSHLDQDISYVNQKGETWSHPLAQQMVHVANHSTYHRGQITTMLRQLGAQPVSTDFLRYYEEQHDIQPSPPAS